MIKLRNIKKGISLVEIIITIAIIAVVSGIVIPVVINYIQKANDVKADATVMEIRSVTLASLTEFRTTFEYDKNEFQKDPANEGLTFTFKEEYKDKIAKRIFKRYRLNGNLKDTNLVIGFGFAEAFAASNNQLPPKLIKNNKVYVNGDAPDITPEYGEKVKEDTYVLCIDINSSTCEISQYVKLNKVRTLGAWTRFEFRFDFI